MPITQEQMVAQMREARANHAEVQALRTLISEYTKRAQATYPSNKELQETMAALAMVVALRPIPDDRETFMNEKYYSRFAKRNAKARERQRLVRSGAIGRTRAVPTSHQPQVIMPREFDGDKPLEFDSATPDDLQNEFAMGGGFGLDTTSNPCEDTSGNPAKESDK